MIIFRGTRWYEEKNRSKCSQTCIFHIWNITFSEKKTLELHNAIIFKKCPKNKIAQTATIRSIWSPCMRRTTCVSRTTKRSVYNSSNKQSVFASCWKYVLIAGWDQRTVWSRVTRLGDFSPLGRLSTLSSFIKIPSRRQLSDTYFHGKIFVLIWTKNWVGLHFGRLFNKLLWSPWSGVRGSLQSRIRNLCFVLIQGRKRGANKQDDQTSLWKNGPKCSPIHFCQN
jgi:hypothetical protein